MRDDVDKVDLYEACVLMALWDIPTPPMALPVAGKVEPETVLADFEGPLTFTFRAEPQERLMLAHLAAVGVGLSRYLVCDTNEEIIHDLQNGMISIRSALLAGGRLLVYDVASDGSVSRSWSIAESQLPADALPNHDVLLTAELEEAQAKDEGLRRFARSDTDGQVAVDGGPVEGHWINLDFWGRFCEKAAALYAEVCAVWQLEVKALQAGLGFESSYGVDLRAERPRGEPEALFGPPSGDAKRRQAFEQMMLMIAEDDPSPQTIRLVQQNQSLRNAYGDVLDVVATGGASLAIRTRRTPRWSRVTSVRAGDRLRVVRDLGYPYSHFTVKGFLIDGGIEPHDRIEPRFALRVGPVEDKSFFSGAVRPEAVEQMRGLNFGAYVEAKLQVLAEDNKKQTYVLWQVKAIPPEDDASP